MNKNQKKPLPFEWAIGEGLYPEYSTDIMRNPNAKAGLKAIHDALVDPVRDEHTGTVITAPCGIGKSTVLSAKTVESAVYNTQRLVVATDRVDRLDRTLADAVAAGKQISNREPILNVSDGNAITYKEIWQAPYKQVVGITPQRIMSMDPDVLEPIFRDGIKEKRTGGKAYKDLFVCDEAVTDVEMDSYTLSQLYAVVGHLRESISPDIEDDIEDGQSAKKAGDLAELLLELIKKDIDRINAGSMTYSEKERKQDRTRVDIFAGYLNALYQFDSRLEDVKEALTGIIQILREKGRIKAESARKSKIEKLVENAEKTKNTTRYSEIQTWIKDIGEYAKSETCKKYIPTELISGLVAQISDFAEIAKVKTAPDEIRRIVEKNKKNIRENSEGCEGIIPIDSFLSIFSPKNVVTMRTIRRGRSKIDNRPQVEITVAQYTLDRLPWGKMPIVIMDGTGDLNPAYTDGRYEFEVIGDFCRPKIPMHIIQYGEVSGAYDLTKDGRAKARTLFHSLEGILGDNYAKINRAKTLFTCQKDLADLARSEGVAPGRLSNVPAATYMSAALTGSNEYKDYRTIVKIGASTISQYVSFLQICCRKPDVWQKVIGMPEMERQQMLRTIYNYNATAENCKEYYSQIRDNQTRTAMVSIVQEFQRLRCRNYPASDDPAELQKYAVSILWIIRGREQGSYPADKESLSEEIVRRIIDRFGGSDIVQYTYHSPILDPYAEDTKTPALIREWYQHVTSGAEYTYSTIASAIGKNEIVVRQAFSRSQSLQDMIAKDEVISQRPLTKKKAKSEDEIKAEVEAAAHEKVMNWYLLLPFGTKYSASKAARECGVPENVAMTAMQTPGMMTLRECDVEVKAGIWSREAQMTLHLE